MPFSFPTCTEPQSPQIRATMAAAPFRLTSSPQLLAPFTCSHPWRRQNPPPRHPLDCFLPPAHSQSMRPCSNRRPCNPWCCHVSLRQQGRGVEEHAGELRIAAGWVRLCQASRIGKVAADRGVLVCCSGNFFFVST
ncbi:hypothetical protein C2845_PM10G14910 [Panicum miliaceum]|uniref:Uncharacterized protein n=1 Tax=Panicum miliaceum TaxID=4540 RepID=A0A3L6PGZ3_PANMI|nr:hypothetical protein C2845_PM10G14910 [Panicum miliaceum]